MFCDKAYSIPQKKLYIINPVVKKENLGMFSAKRDKKKHFTGKACNGKNCSFPVFVVIFTFRAKNVYVWRTSRVGENMDVFSADFKINIHAYKFITRSMRIISSS